jgi:hypothetical protein
MAKTLAVTFGVLLVLMGLLGFVENPLIGIFPVNGADNWLHLLLGIALLVGGVLSKGESPPPPMMSATPPARPM